MKIVETTSRALYVLDPAQRQTNALDAIANVELRYSSDGVRAWAFAPSQNDLAQIELAGAHVAALRVERGIADVTEIDAKDGGKALLALHSYGAGFKSPDPSVFNAQTASIGVTVFDALAPSAAKSRSYAAVLLERLTP